MPRPSVDGGGCTNPAGGSSSWAAKIAPVMQAEPRGLGFEDALAGVAAMHRQEITNLREENLHLRRHICKLQAVTESAQLPEVPPVGDTRQAFERLLLEVAEEAVRQRPVDMEAEDAELAEETAEAETPAHATAENGGAFREAAKARIADPGSRHVSEEPPPSTLSQGLFRNLVGSDPARELANCTFERRLMCQPTSKQRRMERRFFNRIRMDRDVSAARSKLREVVKHPVFNCLCAFIIVLNSCIIGSSVEWMTDHDEEHRVLERSAGACDIFFGVELLLRIVNDGPRFYFFVDDSKGWNTFDFLLVAFSIAEYVFSKSVNVLGSSIKTMKMLRIVRLFRVFRFFRELSDLALMVMDAGRSLIWALVMLAIIVYVFACCFTSNASVYIKREPADAQLVYDLFGSLDRAVYTLIQTTLGGVSWGEVSDQLIKMDSFSLVLFFFYVFFTLLAVLNIITGVFVDNAMELARTQRDFLVQKEMDLKERYVQELRELFLTIDKDCSGTVSIDEIYSYFDDPGVHSYFQALGLDVGDATKLFTLIDDDGSGDVSVDEFIDGCLRLKGQARSIDIFNVIHSCSRIETEIFKLRCDIQGHDSVPERSKRKDVKLSKRVQGSIRALRGVAAQQRASKQRQIRGTWLSSLDDGPRLPQGTWLTSLDEGHRHTWSSADGVPRSPHSAGSLQRSGSFQPHTLQPSLDVLQRRPRDSTQSPSEGTQRQPLSSLQSYLYSLRRPFSGTQPPPDSTQRQATAESLQRESHGSAQSAQEGLQRQQLNGSVGHGSPQSPQDAARRQPNGNLKLSQDGLQGIPSSSGRSSEEGMVRKTLS